MNRRWLLASMGMCAMKVAIAQSVPVTRPMLETATRDPFATMLPAVPPKPATIKPAAPPPPPAPQAPALNLEFAGTMVDPNGRRVVFALAGNAPVTLTQGLLLPNGYQVEAISDKTVELVYPPLGTHATLQIPAAPAFEVR